MLVLGRAALARTPRQVTELAVEPRDLQRDDQQVGQHGHEHDQVRREDVAVAAAHASASRSSRRCPSSRLPVSSTLYMVAASDSIPARQTQKTTNIDAAMSGPLFFSTTGWIRSWLSRMARKLIGTSTMPKSASTADMFARLRP